MQVFLIFDAENPEQNIEQLEAFATVEQAGARCDELNARDYPNADDDIAGWCWTCVEVVPAPESGS